MKRTALNSFGQWLAGVTLAAIVPILASAEEPVRLKVTFGQVYAVSGMTFDWTTVDVNVKNIAFQKSVVMHYKDPAAGTWKDFPLTFSGHYGNYDVFSGTSMGCQARSIGTIMEALTTRSAPLLGRSAVTSC